ncbi:MAG: T9SS type A sorting domain-containing protein [Bacteroidota bacterium]
MKKILLSALLVFTSITAMASGHIVSITGSTNVSCFGGSDGTAAASVSGGVGPFTYSWTPSGGNAATATGLAAGTYTITVTDQSDLSTATTSITITTPTQLTVILTGSTNVSCFGLCNGTAGASANGGTPAYSYTWNSNPFQTTATASGLCPGNYTCTISDGNGCINTTNVVILQPTPVVISSNNSAICPNTCATLTANGSGGSGPITYSWNPGSFTGAAVSVCPAMSTTYTITGTDVNSCTGKTTVVVAVNPKPTVSVPAATICESTTTTLSASGASTYSWSPATGLSNTGIANPIASPISTTTYTVVGTNFFGCTGSTTVIVTVYQRPVITITGTTKICNGSSTTLTASGACGTTWSPATGLSSTTGTTVTANPTTTTTYTIVGTSCTGCTRSVSVTITDTCAIGIQEEISANGIIKVYPNPFSDNTTFVIQSGKLNEIYSFELLDVLGKQVKFINAITSKEFQISREGLPDGIYFYKIHNAESVVGIGKLAIK